MSKLCACVATVLFILIAFAQAQSIGFTQYPSQVVNDLAYPVAWEAGGANVAINLLRAGVYQQTLFSGTGNTFTWLIEDDDDGAIDYALQIVPNGDVAQAVTSGAIWLFEDEDGLLVNGQVIYASIANGPASSGLFIPSSTVASATASSASDVAASASAATSPALTAVRTELVTITSAATVYTFTATVPAATTASGGAETLVLTSNGLTFTTTVPIAAAAPTDTAGAAANAGGGGGLSGGAIAGIVIGILLIIALIVLGLWFRRRRQRQRRQTGETPESPITAFINGGRRGLSNRKSKAAVQPSSEKEDEKAMNRQSLVSPVSPHAHSEMEAAVPLTGQNTGKTFESSELGGSQRHEMSSVAPTYELPAEDVSRDMGDVNKYPATCTNMSRAGTMMNSGSGLDGSVSGISDRTY